MGEKTQQPTPKKLRDAEKKGQIPKSKLLTSAATTLGALLPLTVFGGDAWKRLVAFTSNLLLAQETSPTRALQDGLVLLAVCAAPVLAGAMTASVLAGVGTAGLQFNPDLVSPKLERLDPSEGLKKLFSLRQLVDVLKGLAVAAIIGALFWNAIQSDARVVLQVIQHDGAQGLMHCLSLLTPVLTKSAVLLLALGFADWALMRHRHVKDLMMTQEEVKQEHKNSEGDPHQKSKRKALHKQLAAGGAARGVRSATAVVVNPTHIAVALRYAEDECDAPYIVARGREEDALKLRKEAEALKIPVVRDIPLARSLVQYDVGEEVPEELYQAAAAILKIALETKQGDAS